MKRVAVITLVISRHDETRRDEEIINLLSSLDMDVVRFYRQEMASVKRVTYLGKGKLMEIAQDLQNHEDIEAVIVNDDLTPLQHRSLSEAITKPLFDRTGIILEIFSHRAQSKEARLQVEMARLQYEKSRLVQEDAHFSQVTSGGAYNKGLGEKQIDLDRSRYKMLLAAKKRELSSLVKQRQTTRMERQQSDLAKIALVGYTNAGKSSLLNLLLTVSHQSKEKMVLQEDRLFATLETATRRIDITGFPSFLCTDTVGFIDHLPTALIQAFRSTLEEVKEADLLVQVIDVSDPYYCEQKRITEETLKEIGVVDIPMIYLYNKADRLSRFPFLPDEKSLFTSFKETEDVQDILTLIFRELSRSWHEVDQVISYEKNLFQLQKEAYITSVIEEEHGYHIHGYFSAQALKKWIG